MSDGKPVRATTADEEAVMFQQSWIKAEREADRLRAENEKLRAALAFYTKEENWRRNGPLDANGANYTGGPATSIIKDTEND